MSRRDTIIIAVLVNAAILLILFATAMRSDSKKSKEEAATPLVKEESCELDETVATNLPDYSTDDQAIEILGGVTEIPLDKGESTEPLPQVIAAKPTTTTPTVAAPASAKVTATTASKTPSVSTVTQSAALAASHPASSPSLPLKEEAISSVTVKKGDALEKIARAHHTTTAAIMKANNLTSTQLKVGQVLKVPNASAVETVSTITAPSAVAKKEAPVASKPLPVASKTPVTSTPSNEGFYTVKEGDNPWLIASRVGIKLEDLLRLNGIDNEKAKKLRPGDRLRVR